MRQRRQCEHEALASQIIGAAIEVSKVAEIPVDWDGAMGVPISFLDKHNPEQFEILGIDHDFVKQATGKRSRFKLNGKIKYARIVIRNKRLQE